jgi:protein phosphatase 1 regulatory subunit 37
MAPVAHRSSESQSAEASSEPQRPAPLPPVDAPPKRPRTAQPTRSILKPPPPPPKPTISNKLRDVLGSINPKFFDAQVMVEPPAAWGGRLGRFVGGVTQAVPVPSVNSDPGPSTAPAQPQAPQRTGKPLKRATFMLPALTITYPISSSTPPWSGKVVEDRKSIETTYRELLLSHAGAEYWTAERLVQLYELACKGREERPKPVIRKALKVCPPWLIRLTADGCSSPAWPPPSPSLNATSTLCNFVHASTTSPNTTITKPSLLRPTPYSAYS